MMKVILKEDVPNLGVVGDLVAVKDGYGRNYLIPQGKAAHASARSVRELDHQKRLAAHHREKATVQAQTDKDRIEGLSVCISAKVAPPQLNEDDEPIAEILQKLFGSVTNRDLAAVLKGTGLSVDHRRISLPTPVRTVGKFAADVRLDGGVTATLPFWVIPEGAADIESEKKRVEAAQETLRKQAEEAAAAERIRAAPAPPPPPPPEPSEEAGDADADTDADGPSEAA